MGTFISVGLLAASLTLPLPGGPVVESPARPSLRAVIVRDAPRFAPILERQSASSVQARGKGSWMQRHPSCFGAAAGFTVGFLAGYLPGDDAVFDDFVAEFNGLVLGGIGAGAGAVIGWLLGR